MQVAFVTGLDGRQGLRGVHVHAVGQPGECLGLPDGHRVGSQVNMAA